MLPTVGEGAGATGGRRSAAASPAAVEDASGVVVDIERLSRDASLTPSQRRSLSAPMKLRGSLQQQMQQFEAGAACDPELGADLAALCRGVSGSQRSSRPRPRAALPGRWLQNSDVQAHAVELGIDLTDDADLLWIAEEALSALDVVGWSMQEASSVSDPGSGDDGGEPAIWFEHMASGERLAEHPVRAYYKELVRRARTDRWISASALADAATGSVTSPGVAPSTLKAARLSAVESALSGELAATVRWLGWGETSNVCEILLNAVRPRIPRALRAEMHVRLGAPPHCSPRVDMQLGLTPDGKPLYCLSAFRHLGAAGGTSAHVTGHYTVRLEQHDGAVGDESFCGKLLCGTATHGSQFVFCDDPANFYGWPRELGAVVIRGGERGHVQVLLPRVTLAGAAAQFRVLRPQDGMLSKFRRGEDVQHMMSLQGHLMRHTASASPTTPGEPETWTLQLFSEMHACVVFACRWRAPSSPTAAAFPDAAAAATGDSPSPTPSSSSSAAAAAGPAIEMSFAHPLSPYQAGCLALSISHHLQFEFPGRSAPAAQRRQMGVLGRDGGGGGAGRGDASPRLAAHYVPEFP